MKRLKIAIFLLGTCTGMNGTLLAQYHCPTSIGYATFCPFAGSGFFMYGAEPDPLATSAELNFDGGDINCNTTISLVISDCSSQGRFYADNIAPYCQDPNPSGTVIFNTGLECVYIDGDLVPCNNLVTECKETMIEFAKDFIQDSPNCKLWEGPCATESEIWRSGAVLIGANSWTSGYKLGVKGGITTEMLQICKPEWCDYVFSDTFNLMPLQEVNDYLVQNGHLPGCTPGAVIAQEGGFLLDKETVHQQEKIEEIFLHLINAQHRLNRLDNKLPAGALQEALPIQLPGSEYTSASSEEILPLLQIECFQIKSAPNGIGGIVVSPDSGPYNVSWSGAAGNGNMSNIVCNGTIKINDLAAGNYNITVSNATGVLGTCNFSILSGVSTTCELFNDPSCKQAIIDMLEEEAFGTPPDCKQWEGDPCSHDGEIYRLGNVGIGTSVGKAGYSLAVKGGILTDKFRVELCESGPGWCDYVFDEAYPLQPLLEVESFIKKNKHLPGSVTQNEVTENGGFEMRSVKLDHQKKIEEAYLHLIALDKKKKELEQRINLLTVQH